VTAPITTIAGLRAHLQWAIELEHATLPPYLCALYSLEPGTNDDARAMIGGVFVEEMLHLALAANVLNAVGGRPVLDGPRLLPPHPRRLPHSDPSLTVSLAPFGREALETFLRIERPAPRRGRPEADGYETIGQFYAAIEQGLKDLCDRLGESVVFSGDPSRQVRDTHFRHSSGRMIAVDGLESALAALAEIVDEGEGTGRGDVWDGDADVLHPGQSEVAHYFRFDELRRGRRYGPGDTATSGPTGAAVTVDFSAVRPMRRNPRVTDHPVGSPIRVAQDAFNRSYCDLLRVLETAFDGSPQAMGAAVGGMYGIRAQAEALLQLPDGEGHVAGPTFEYVPAPDARPTIGVREPVTSDGRR
jgi:hypothetical protein